MSYRIAGIDVHKKMLAVVVSNVEVESEFQFERRMFGGNPEQLRLLAAWLLEQEAEEVVMESTAQYWKPVWGALERYWKPIREKREGAKRRSGTLHLAQAQSNRGRRGRKKDFVDAERLVKRLVARELTLSFVPDVEQRLWRALTRKKYQLRRDLVRLNNQLESLLEETHIKLSSLVSDLLGVSAVPRNLNLLGVTGSSVSFAPLDSPEAAVLGSGNSCPSDLVHSLELARAVPVLRKLATVCNGPIGGQWCSYTDTFPRVSVIQVLAERCTYFGDSARARVALQEQLEIVEEIPEEHRIAYLATAADLYLRIGDPEAATRVIEKGFTAARGLYDREIVSPQMQGFPEGMWNSAEAFRRMITLGVIASMEVTLKAVSEIPDPSLRELEQVMIARALLGVPVRRNMTASVGSFCTVETEVTYEQL